MNRWCIVSGPRSGSTYFEACIYSALLAKDADAQKLQEFIHPYVAFDNTVSLLPNKKIKFIEGTHNGLKTKTQLVDHIKSIIALSDITQSLTCRVFCQFNHHSKNDFIDFLSLLVNQNFQLINLNRHLLDRAISLYFALETGIWHRTVIDNQIKLIRHSDAPQDKNIDKISVDVKKFKSIYNYIGLDLKLRNEIFQSLPCINVSYENMYNDVIKYNIPFLKNETYIKVHNDIYENYILNYKEVVDSIKK